MTLTQETCKIKYPGHPPLISFDLNRICDPASRISAVALKMLEFTPKISQKSLAKHVCFPLEMFSYIVRLFLRIFVLIYRFIAIFVCFFIGKPKDALKFLKVFFISMFRICFEPFKIILALMGRTGQLCNLRKGLIFRYLVARVDRQLDDWEEEILLDQKESSTSEELSLSDTVPSRDSQKLLGNVINDESTKLDRKEVSQDIEKNLTQQLNLQPKVDPLVTKPPFCTQLCGQVLPPEAGKILLQPVPILDTNADSKEVVGASAYPKASSFDAHPISEIPVLLQVSQPSNPAMMQQSIPLAFTASNTDINSSPSVLKANDTLVPPRDNNALCMNQTSEQTSVLFGTSQLLPNSIVTQLSVAAPHEMVSQTNKKSQVFAKAKEPKDADENFQELLDQAQQLVADIHQLNRACKFATEVPNLDDALKNLHRATDHLHSSLPLDQKVSVSKNPNPSSVLLGYSELQMSHGIHNKVEKSEQSKKDSEKRYTAKILQDNTEDDQNQEITATFLEAAKDVGSYMKSFVDEVKKHATSSEENSSTMQSYMLSPEYKKIMHDIEVAEQKNFKNHQ